MRDLDKAITALPETNGDEFDITDAFLKKLSHIQRLHVETNLPVVNLLAWYADIDTRSYVDQLADGEPTVASLYAQLFTNKTVSGQLVGENPAALSGTLSGKAAAIAAALQISVEDFTLLHADVNVIPRIPSPAGAGTTIQDDRLTVVNLSRLYRHAKLAKALKLPIRTYLTTLELVNSAPFATTGSTIQFIKHIDKIRASGFKIEDLDYLLRNKFSTASEMPVADDVIATVLDAMRDDLRKVSAENTFVAAELDDNAATSDPNGELTRKKLALLNWDSALVENVIAVLNDTFTYQTTLASLAPTVVFPESLKSRISYTEQKLRFTGTMTVAEQALLVASPNTDALFMAAVGELFRGPKDFVKRYMARFSVPVFSVPVTDVNLKSLLATFKFPDALKNKIYYDTVAETLRFVGVMTEAERSVLLKLSSNAEYLKGIPKLFVAPDASTPQGADIFLTSADAAILFGISDDNPQARFLLVLKQLLPYLQTTLSEIVVKQRLGEYLKLDATAINGLIKKWVKSQGDPQQKAIADFLEPVFAESSPNIGSSKDAFPRQFNSYLLLSKISILVLKFNMTPGQLQWLFNSKLNAGWLDLNALPLGAAAPATSLFRGWARLTDLFQLRDALPRGEVLLADIFTAATAPGAQTAPDAQKELDKVVEILSKSTQWELRSLKSLSGPNGFNYSVRDFAGESAMLRLSVAFAMLKRLGASADQCLSWAKTSPTGNDARELTSLVRAKYDDAEWLDLAKSLRDPLRERQRSALVAYLVQKFGVRNANELYDDFLIDVEMSPCMMTTRIKQAISSVQLFIQRSLMNLEKPDVSLTPDDAKEWSQWRKWYRVWEANRKVLFYPENWIEPELRDDKSPFYKDLESELLQSDVTMATAEDAFLHYLEKLDQVARLEIVGMYHQREYLPDSLQPEIDILHVFGRTYTTTHIYFYRRLEDKVWSAWEKVDLDIEGDHLIPIAWNRRLYLFWAIFTEKSEQPTKDQRKKDEDPIKNWEIKLAWSEYKNKSWSPKKVSKNPLRHRKYPYPPEFVEQEPKDFSFKTRVVPRVLQGLAGDQLSIECYGTTVEEFAPITTVTPAVVPPQSVRLLLMSLFPFKVTFTGISVSRHINVQLLVGGAVPRRSAKTTTSVEFWSDNPAKLLEKVDMQSDGSAYLTNPTMETVDCYLVSTAYTGVARTPFWTNGPLRPIAQGVYVDLDEWSPGTPIPASERVNYPAPRPTAMNGIGEFTLDDSNGDLVAVPVPNVVPSMVPIQLRPIRATKFEGMTMVDQNTQEAMRTNDWLAKTPGLFRLLGMHQSYVLEYIDYPFFYQDNLSAYFVSYVRQPAFKLLFAPFYHAKIGSFIKSLNRFGIKGLLKLANQRVSIGHHFYIADSVVRDYAIANGYLSEGIAGYVYNSQVSGTTPLHRLYNGQISDHFYTTDISERDFAIANGYSSLGIAGYVHNPQVSGTTPLYRLLRTKIGDHFYTTDIVERDSAIAQQGYQDEGVACYIFKSPVAGATPLYRLINLQVAFEQKYKPGVLVGTPYPVEDVDFEYHGAYSLYNWELFFHTPFLIAMQLSNNQRFEEAQKWFHYIFDPTATDSPDRPGDPGIERFWRVKPFYQEAMRDIQTLEELIADSTNLEAQVAKWEADPFKPHVVARMRVVAYMKAVVMRYIDNLIAWGDQLFRRDTLESINEATQLYILAAQILGRRPENIPARVKAKIQTFRTLNDVATLDSLSNAMVEIESFFAPAVAPAPVKGDQSAPPLRMQYFCITGNDKLLGYWDTVSDRLFKIRHCMNIEGVERSLPIFEPKIDPGLLVRAAAAGVDISSALNDINAAVPHYRFNVMVQKASELCNDVKALGGAFLSALEKRDAEALALLRSSHEVELLTAIRAIKAQQIEEAGNTLEGLRKYEDVVTTRQQYYQSRPFLNPFEIGHIGLTTVSLIPMAAHAGAEVTAAMLHLVPDAKSGGPTTVGVTIGGSNIASAVQAFGSAAGTTASILSTVASLSATLGGFQRRQDDWTHQADLATKELKQVKKQIIAADIRLAISDNELLNHDLQIKNAKEVDAYMRHQKFTNQQLYSWMVGQLSGIYFQSYQLAYDVAKRAERTYRYELGLKDSNFIQFGYWDSLKKGLLSGERLYLDLKRMDAAYLDKNKREHEITKHISLITIDPISLVKLKETGECFVNLPEALFDIDYPGHYMRRIKSVSITIPCVTGPYAGVNSTLTQLSSSIRHANTLSGGKYSRGSDDTRFTDSFGSIQSIVTSSGQNDSGLFEANLRDERYLPFEGQGAISTWRIQLPMEFKSFDYDTISDVVLHLRYTARDAGGALRLQATKELSEAVNNFVQSGGKQGLTRIFSLRHEFPTEWYRFLNPAETVAGQTLELTLTQDRFPFQFRGRTININRADVLLKFKDISDSDVFKEVGNSKHTPLGAYGSSNKLKLGLTLTGGPRDELVLDGNNSLGLPRDGKDFSPAKEIRNCMLDIADADIQSIAPSLLNQISVSGVVHWRLKPEFIEDMFIVYQYSI